MRKLFSRVLPAVLLALAAAAPARGSGFLAGTATIPTDDGVSLAATLYVPSGTPPPGGWPGVMLFHGKRP